MKRHMVDFSTLTGLTLDKILYSRDDDDKIFFLTSGGTFIMFHDQDCCESVNIADVVGSPEDLCSAFITDAEETTSGVSDKEDESSTWTFYKIATPQGDLTISWFGSSNGYYSEMVSFYKTDEEVPVSATLLVATDNKE